MHTRFKLRSRKPIFPSGRRCARSINDAYQNAVSGRVAFGYDKIAVITLSVYPWKRFWYPREGLASLADDGFLLDPDSEYARYYQSDAVPYVHRGGRYGEISGDSLRSSNILWLDCSPGLRGGFSD